MAASSPLHLYQSLKNLGFSSNEVEVLVTLLHTKSGTAKELSRKTAISMSGVQFALSGLTRRKIVKISAGNEDQYEICSNEEFQRWIKEKKQAHEQIYEEAQQDIEGFFNLSDGHDWHPKILYYEDEEGIQEIYSQMLDYSAKGNKEIYSWLDIKRIRDVLGDYLYDYIDERVKKGIKSHDIIPKNEENLVHKQKGELRDMKFAQDLDINGEIRIFDNRVSIITFDGEKPIGFMFESSFIAELFKAVFQSQWNEL